MPDLNGFSATMAHAQRDQVLAMEQLLAGYIEQTILQQHDDEEAEKAGKQTHSRLRYWNGQISEGLKALTHALQTHHDCLFANDAPHCICQNNSDPSPVDGSTPENSLMATHTSMTDPQKLQRKIAVVQWWHPMRSLLIDYVGGPHQKLRYSILNFDKLLEAIGSDLADLPV